MVLRNFHSLKKDRIRRGLTLIEITVVIAVLLTLMGASMYVVGGYREWKKGSAAAVELRKVYNAQRTYLADNPTASVGSLTEAKIIPYLSDGATSLPSVEDLDGNALSIKVDVVPPVLLAGNESTYDPSGKSDDGLWDVGSN